jgi:hypothetical protein
MAESTSDAAFAVDGDGLVLAAPPAQARLAHAPGSDSERGTCAVDLAN